MSRVVSGVRKQQIEALVEISQVYATELPDEDHAANVDSLIVHELAAVDGMDALMAAVRSDDKHLRISASSVLSRLVRIPSIRERVMADTALVADVLRHLKSGEIHDWHASAATIEGLVRCDNARVVCRALADAGAVEALVDALAQGESCGRPVILTSITSALSHLCSSSANRCEKAVAAGAVTHLAKLGSLGASLHPADDRHDDDHVPEACQTVLALLSSLHQLINLGSAKLRKHDAQAAAAALLRTIAKGRWGPAREEATFALYLLVNKKKLPDISAAVRRAGAVPILVQQLREGSVDGQRSVVDLLHALTCRNMTSGPSMAAAAVEAGFIEATAAFLSQQRPAVQRNRAAVLLLYMMGVGGKAAAKRGADAGAMGPLAAAVAAEQDLGQRSFMAAGVLHLLGSVGISSIPEVSARPDSLPDNAQEVLRALDLAEAALDQGLVQALLPCVSAGHDTALRVLDYLSVALLNVVSRSRGPVAAELPREHREQPAIRMDQEMQPAVAHIAALLARDGTSKETALAGFQALEAMVFLTTLARSALAAGVLAVAEMWLRKAEDDGAEDEVSVLLAGAACPVQNILTCLRDEHPEHMAMSRQEAAAVAADVAVAAEKVEAAAAAAAGTAEEAAAVCAACSASSTPDGKPLALRLCSACKNVRYCGAQCQRKHWKVHKQRCAGITNGKPRPMPVT